MDAEVSRYLLSVHETILGSHGVSSTGRHLIPEKAPVKENYYRYLLITTFPG